MKFYITVEGVHKLKRSFLNLKLFSIIDISEIFKQFEYEEDQIDEYKSFIVTTKILDMIRSYTRSKRTRGIIYSNPNINKDIIKNLIEELDDVEKISEIVLLDDYNVPKLQHFYPFFTEVVFFPSIKKIRLIECKSIKEKIVWKI